MGRDVVIVTEQCYLICENIVSVIVQALTSDDDDLFDIQSPARHAPTKKRHKRPKRLTQKQRMMRDLQDRLQYQKVIITYIPVGAGTGLRPSLETIYIIVKGKKECQDFYNKVVQQLREQLPDVMYLDQLVERLLGAPGKEQE